MVTFRTYSETRYHTGQEVVILSADVSRALLEVVFFTSYSALESKQELIINLSIHGDARIVLCDLHRRDCYKIGK